MLLHGAFYVMVLLDFPVFPSLHHIKNCQRLKHTRSQKQNKNRRLTSLHRTYDGRSDERGKPRRNETKAL